MVSKINIVQKILSIILRFLKWILYIIGALILLFLWIVLISLYDGFVCNKFRRTKPFNLIVWQKASVEEDKHEYARCYMYRDLVKNHLRLNMTYTEVIELLGEPTYAIADYYTDPELKKREYFLGRCTHDVVDPWNIWGPEDNFLNLYFDHSEKLVAFSRKEYISETDIQQNKNISIKNKKHLFTCYLDDSKCFRKVKKTDFNHYEYCKKDEVEFKWGYKVW